MNSTLSPLLRQLLTGSTLSSGDIYAAFQEMVAGNVSQGEMGALLALLATRIPTPAELVGATRVMREHVERLETRTDPAQIVDTCGTGGAPKTFNVSTLSAIVAAASGAIVAKHGNRSRTGRGSAEFLEALGIRIEAPSEVQASCLDELGLCFCFAVRHHPATRAVMPVRQALGFPTLFNLLGPLTNPAGARRQVLGVYDARLVEPIAQALVELGVRRALVLHSDDGLDELSVSSGTQLLVVGPGGVSRTHVTPEELGLARAPRDSVSVRDLDHAVQLGRSILSGQERGAPRSAVLMASAAALFVAERAASLQEGVRLAAEAIDSGRAQDKLARWIQLSNA